MEYNKEILNRLLSDEIAIAVRTAEEWDKFMYLLEEETSVQWLVGKNPTELNKWHEWGNNSAITCGFRQPSRLGYADTNFYKASGYEIIEFEELIEGEENMKYTGQNWGGSMKYNKKLIEGEENMEYTEQDYRYLFVKTKIGGFFMNSGYFAGFRNHKGYVLSPSSSKQEEYLDFLAEMRDYGIERDEIEQIIIKDYLTEKGSKNE